MFPLHAYLIATFGDIPAVSMLMRMKGHNGISPCRMCNIKALPVPNAAGNAHYVPLDRTSHPRVQANPDLVSKYDPQKLPLRTHREFMEQAQQVSAAPSAAAEERFAKEYGIKGVPILSQLSSLFFPHSFPFDFMHLIYENVLKNLILLWSADFKGLDEGTGSYKLDATVWEAIGAATAASGATIPTAYGTRPKDVAGDRTSCSAKTWSFWLLYLGPILLERQFTNNTYYVHFVELAKLVNLCLQFEYTSADIQTIRDGFINWVQQYESLYYQFRPERLSACPLTIHALLHIADSIEAAGPVWAYWAFPMERFCGRLQPYIKNRRFPFASLDGHVVAFAQLEIIKIRHACADSIRLGPVKHLLPSGALQVPNYPTCALVPPRRSSEVPSDLLKKIIICLSTRFGLTNQRMAPHVKSPAVHIEQWAKVRRLDGGDLMLASSLVATMEDRRDATYVRFVQYVDANARSRNAPVRNELKTFFGQLQHIFSLTLAASDELGLEEETTFFLAAVRPCLVERSHPNGLDIHYYSKYEPAAVVDITTIQCLVGRARTLDGRMWAIFDRSGELARPFGDEA
uniref:Uncharacterized protein n=1 Tax=Mycena chlorophos TaxID=658473 RepID=A0ABQ0L8H4_MYCCL|nr:predicted protein [Mycena chlorophos]